MDHIGFKVESLKQFKADLDKMARQNPFLAAREIDYNDEGAARLKLLDRCPHGSYQIADPVGTLIDVAEA